jgi:hypothetical protein
MAAGGVRVTAADEVSGGYARFQNTPLRAT